MLKKMMWLLLALLLASCSVLPFNSLTALAEDEPAPTCPPVCPSCPPAVVTVVVTVVMPTSAATQAAATETAVPPVNTEVPTATPTQPQPSAVPPTATATATQVIPPTATATATKPASPTATATAVPSKPYSVQANSPVYLQNFAHLDKGCSWLGVAGQVFDRSGKPVSNLVVSVEGFIGNQTVDGLGLTGLNSPYGPGGYEIVLADQAVDTTRSLFVTLYDLSGNALSLPVIINTYADCSKNLVIVNFKQNPAP